MSAGVDGDSTPAPLQSAKARTGPGSGMPTGWRGGGGSWPLPLLLRICVTGSAASASEACRLQETCSFAAHDCSYGFGPGSFCPCDRRTAIASVCCDLLVVTPKPSTSLGGGLCCRGARARLPRRRRTSGRGLAIQAVLEAASAEVQLTSEDPRVRSRWQMQPEAKSSRRTSLLRSNKPHTVILSTLTAAKLLDTQAWVHLSSLKRVPPPDR